jgi:phosphomevalonate kinase
LGLRIALGVLRPKPHDQREQIVIAWAPGKIVISGAYSVLEGAPALVGAVDRYVVADSSRRSAIVSEEVLAAYRSGAIDIVPWFDAAGLRTRLPDGTTRKIGLGSSAAILVASITAVFSNRISDEAELRRAVMPVALAAHREAQPLGSGVDVAASVHGGIVQCLRHEDGSLDVSPASLPEGLVFEVFTCPVASSTGQLLEKIETFKQADPTTYRTHMDVAMAGARDAAATQDADAFIKAVSVQVEALGTLGRAAGAQIVIRAVAELHGLAAQEGAVFGPSGAGGGDIALWIGKTRPSEAFLARAAFHRLEPLGVIVGARGVYVG